MRHPRVMFAIALAGVLATREAAGDITHLKSPSHVETQKGSKLDLPPGYFLDEQTWQDRDAVLKKAQDDATRFKAENDSLRKTSNSGSTDTRFMVITFAIGVFSGYVAYHALK